MYEWQYAAQGTDGRLYPWGNDKNLSNFPAPVSNSRTVPALADVTQHPEGASPFGVEDMVGNVWQYTSEFNDGHTRTVVLRGSSLFVPTIQTPDYEAKAKAFPIRVQYVSATETLYRQHLNWYFPPALELNRHNKYALMDDSFERAATLGFRCLKDLPESQPPPFHYSGAV